RLAAGQVEQVHVVANALAGRTEGPVLLFPLTGLFALPAAAQPRRLPVRRPADELRPGALLAGQLLGQHAPARAVGLDHDGALRRLADVAPAGQVGAELGVADEEVGQRLGRWA